MQVLLASRLYCAALVPLNVTAPPYTISGSVPVLVSVKVWVAVLDGAATKLSVPLDKLAVVLGAFTVVPVRLMTWVVGVALSVSVMVELLTPAAWFSVGLNLASRVQLAPAATLPPATQVLVGGMNLAKLSGKHIERDYFSAWLCGQLFLSLCVETILMRALLVRFWILQLSVADRKFHRKHRCYWLPSKILVIVLLILLHASVLLPMTER